MVKPDRDRVPTLPFQSAAFRRGLLSWYQQHARRLPWRETSDPYLIWMSEIMLQQTTVAAVIPYFERFRARFPTLAALAAAEESEVFRFWEGLGYYSRARNLHRAARQVVQERGGVIPRTVDELRTLPGVGPYTAGAIASFAFDTRAPIVEANTQRLYARLLGLTADLSLTESQRRLWTFAADVLPPRKGSGIVNQALMELGSQVCQPTLPQCDQCPASRYCAAYHAGLQAVIPRPKTRVAPTPLRECAVVLTRAKRVLLRQCAPGERWAGLWDFPRFDCTEHGETVSLTDLQQLLLETHGVQAELDRRWMTIKHSVTRFRITLDVVCGGVVTSSRQKLRNGQWCELKDLEGLPLSVTGRRIAQRLLQEHRQKPLF